MPTLTMSRNEEDVGIYLRIRQEDARGRKFGDRAWEQYQQDLSSDHVRRCVRQLLNNEILKAAFDPLLDVPALREGMRVTTLHKLIGAKSDEVRTPCISEQRRRPDGETGRRRRTHCRP